MTKLTKPDGRVGDVASDRILDAAARLFRHQGYAATTVRDIARAAGILPGSLHYRYASKEDLLIALLERAIDRLIEGVLAAIAHGQDAVDRLRLGVHAHLRMLLSGDDGVYVLLYDWRSLSADAAQAILKQRARYEHFIDELMAQAALVAPLRPGVDLRMLRLFGFGAINWVAQWYEPGGPYTPDQIADHFWDYIAYGALYGDPLPRTASTTDPSTVETKGAERGSSTGAEQPR
jgi:AcrR family transcriptional regulator